MKLRTFVLSGLTALALVFSSIWNPAMADDQSGRMESGKILISNGSTFDPVTKKLTCQLYDAHGNFVGVLTADLSDTDAGVPHAIAIQGGSLESVSRFEDPEHEVFVKVTADADSEYWLFAGEHVLSEDDPDYRASGSLGKVTKVINRCKFLVVYDEQGNVTDVKCISCVYILI